LRVCVALVVQHEMRILRIVICGLSGCAQYFSTLSGNLHKDISMFILYFWQRHM